MPEDDNIKRAEEDAAPPPVAANAALSNDATSEQPSSPPPPLEKEPDVRAREISTKEAYFASLNAWVKHANISQNAMALFPWYLLSSYPQIFQNQAAAAGLGMPPLLGMAGGATFQNQAQQQQQQQPQAPPLPPQMPNADANAMNVRFRLHILDDQAQAEIINRTGGYEYVIAPFWKRVVAEMIDVLILLLLKVMVTFTVMNIFDLDLGFDLDKEVLRKALDDDDYTGFLAVSMDFLAFSSDLLLLEVLTKVIVCFYEAIWTTMYGGATPGKALMQLRILHVEAVLPLQPPQPPQLGFQAPGGGRVQMRALIFPGATPGFRRAFARAVAKNLIMTLLFPMCFIMIFFKNNRTAYDIITKTIVVEAANAANPPVLRRQQR